MFMMTYISYDRQLKRWRRMATLIACLLAGLSSITQASLAAEPAPLIPLEDFFRNPQQTNFQISPNGSYLAYLAPWQNRLNVFVRSIGSKEKPIQATNARERDIAGYSWAGNDRLVYIQDEGGNENYRLYGVNRDGTASQNLTPFENVQVRLIDDLEDDEEHMLIAMNRRNPSIHDVYRLNVKSGKLKLIANNPGTIAGWMTDHDGKLRVAIAQEGLQTKLLYRPTEQDEFREVLSTDFRNSVMPLLFTFDNQRLYVASNLNRDKQAIFEFDPTTGKLGKLIFEHPEVDVSSVGFSKVREVLTYASYVTDRLHYHFFDKDRAKLQATLEQKLPDREVVIVDSSKDERKFLIRTYSDRSRGGYYYFDRDNEIFTQLAEVSPWLIPNQLASMRPIAYKSRDGLTIHGYLTLPVGVAPRHLPVVVHPHGGPEARDVWGFNPEVQFLANRGIAVLQPNFRISTGYGKRFWEAGFKQWGKAMQNDLSDGVAWLVAQGIADPQRVAIYGASYGGYAALAGLTFTPDLYACGVSYVGPSNLFTLLDSFPPYWELGRTRAYATIGDPVADKDLLKAVSPVFHAEKIKAPLLVAQGANDPRVKQAESDQIVEALRSRDVEVEYMVKENEGHGFRNEENQIEFYRALEAFLSNCIGSRESEESEAK